MTDTEECATEWCDADPVDGSDYCEECGFGRGLAGAEPPEGGWPRGSDMDRL